METLYEGAVLLTAELPHAKRKVEHRKENDKYCRAS